MKRNHLYSQLLSRVRELRRFIQVLAGPRQVGKTTLARQVIESSGLAAIRSSQLHGSAITGGLVAGHKGFTRELACHPIRPQTGRKYHCPGQSQRSVSGKGGGDGVGVVAELQNAPTGTVAEIIVAGAARAGLNHAPQRTVVSVDGTLPRTLPRSFGSDGRPHHGCG